MPDKETLEEARKKLLESLKIDDSSTKDAVIDLYPHATESEDVIDNSIHYKDVLNNNAITNTKAYIETQNGVIDAYQNTSASVSNKEVTSNIYTNQSYANASGTSGAIASLDSSVVEDSSSLFDYSSTVEYANSGNGGYAALSAVGNTIEGLGNSVIKGASILKDFRGYLNDMLATWASNDNNWASETLGTLGTVISRGAGILAENFTNYNDGATETAYGYKQETSWRKFVSSCENTSAKYRVNQLKTTPFDSESSDLLGHMILGAPFSFADRADPRNRVLLDSYVKDLNILSLTPGLPKYNGSRYTASAKNDILQQTSDYDSMMNYLIKNGVDASNMKKDKRYYTFSPSYGKFYSYLETMLNTIWVKLGLATNEDNKTFNLMTFFKDLQTSTNDGADPLEKYMSAIGFVVNPTGTVSESISNGKTSYGQSYASQVNSTADTYEQLNYLTGMGTAGAAKELARKSAISVNFAQQVKEFFSGKLTNMIGLAKKWGSKLSVAGYALGALAGGVMDYAKQVTTADVGVELQQFATSNGMHVMYPELWSDGGGYSKSMSFDFNFTSPYGDPLSIFKYVYVPFCTLLCFTLPRAADDNGYVSPFFVRADLPGLFTCDLGIVSNMSYTRGGPNGLFTKDGLPRSISGSITLDDLYPYLAMSRRISFLSANPSYTSFLDSFTGFNAVYKNNDASELNTYWRYMLNRVNGNNSSLNGTYNSLWNRFDSDGRHINYLAASTTSSSKFLVPPKSINWMRKV